MKTRRGLFALILINGVSFLDDEKFEMYPNGLKMESCAFKGLAMERYQQNQLV